MTELRDVFARIPAAVNLVTTMSAAGPTGMTASSVCCLSLEPPLVLVCVDNRSRTLHGLRRCRRFGVNLLRDQHAELADAFARPDVDKASRLREVAHHRVGEVVVLDDALAWLVCRLCAAYPGGDHTIVVGHVEALGHRPGEPLVRHDRRYRALAPMLTNA
jgi:3-hydroxy-9,10-secoandrosta-1,3,5(10)-triene-9,17-dione monooxygenase reductase component